MKKWAPILVSAGALWMVFMLCSKSLPLAAAQDGPKSHVRFFNDSAKAVNFYVDGQFGCSVPANLEGNNAYCDTEAPVGEHSVSVKGARLRSQSCQLNVVRRDSAEAGAEAHLPKHERLNCFSYAYDSGT